MNNEVVENLVVPIMAKPGKAAGEWRPLGTGFFFGRKGHLLTCRHVVDDVASDETIVAYQVGARRELPIRVLHRSTTHDIAVCRTPDPGLHHTAPLLDIYLGHDVFSLGYVYEPSGQDSLPIVERFFKGNVTGISREFPDSYELSFPSLTGMSGAPLWAPYRVEGEQTDQRGIVGILYMSRDSRVQSYSEHVVDADGEVRREVESRIVEFGLAYNANAIRAVLRQDFDPENDIEYTDLRGATPN